MSGIQICIRHNQPIVMHDQTISDKSKSGLCLFCIQQKISNLKIVDEIDYGKQNNYDKLKDKTKSTTLILTQLLEQLSTYQQLFKTILDKFTFLILEQIQVVKNFENNLSIDLRMDEQENQIELKIQQIQQIVSQQLNNLKQATNVDKLFVQLQLLNSQTNQKQQPSPNQAENSEKKPYQYKLIEKFNKKENEQCFYYAIAFNHDSSEIFLGCNNIINVNKFQNGLILNEIQQLNSHTNEISFLSFMKKSKELVSGSKDHSIIIWRKNNENKWSVKQKLLQHQNALRSLVMNFEENLLISGSDDKTIKFWEKQSDQWVCSKTINTTFTVESLSFDDANNKLIACGYDDPIIFVIQSNLNNQDWQIIQKLQIEQWGYRLCFVDSNTFAFQPYEREYLEIYEMDQILKQFRKTYDSKVKGNEDCVGLFPCQIIKEKGILIAKNSHFLNILKRQDKNQFIIHQSIDLLSVYSFGRISDDGEYLVTWDNQSKEIQIRKLEINIQ